VVAGVYHADVGGRKLSREDIFSTVSPTSPNAYVAEIIKIPPPHYFLFPVHSSTNGAARSDGILCL
jgi:hypothetical protein